MREGELKRKEKGTQRRERYRRLQQKRRETETQSEKRGRKEK